MGIAVFIVLLAIAAVVVYFKFFSYPLDKDGMVYTPSAYSQITMEQAKELFASSEEDLTIVDVRRADEYGAGHIPGAINIPNESIHTEMLEELPDLEQTIYVYCRSGNRSRQAAEKLAAIGYTNIVEFGGIIDWTGDVEK